MKSAALVIATLVTMFAMPAPGVDGEDVNARTAQVAAVLGTLRVDRPAGEAELRVGDEVQVGDRLRTAVGDRAKLVLADDAVIDLGSGTELLIESRHGSEAQDSGSVLILNRGRIRAIAPQGGDAAARFEVETPAAIAFRGGDFLISYDPTAETSQVVAVDGHVSVAGKLGVVGGVVDVEPGFGTEVRKGRLPTTPQEADAGDVQRLVQATAMLGTGREDGLDVLHPALAGRQLATGDAPRRRGPAGQGLMLAAPGEFLADRLSADVRTNTQPLLEYKRRNPGTPGASGVQVDF